MPRFGRSFPVPTGIPSRFRFILFEHANQLATASDTVNCTDAQELLLGTEGTFEDGTTNGWQSYGNTPAPTFANSTTQAHSGTHSLKVTNNGNTNIVYGSNYHAVTGSTDVLSGTAWVFTDSTRSVAVEVYFYTSAHGFISNNGIFKSCPANTWTQLDLQAAGLTAPSNAAFAIIAIVDSSAVNGSVIYIDDVQLYKLNSVAAFNFPSVNRTGSDTVTVSDSAGRTWSPSRTASDTVTVSDSAGQNLVAARTASDTALCEDQTPNLLVGDDANFDGGTLGSWGWRGSGATATVAISNAQSHSGSYSLLMTLAGSGNNVIGPSSGLRFGTAVGRKFTVTAWVRPNTTRVIDAEVYFFKAPGFTYVSNQGVGTSCPANTWTQISATITALSASATAIYCIPAITDTDSTIGDTLYVDDVSFIEWDFASPGLVLARGPSDTALCSDSATRALADARTASDTALASDSASRGATSWARTSSDTALASDSASHGLVLARSSSDTALASDSASGARTFSRTGSDTALASDVASRAAQQLARTGTDVVLTSDSASRASQGSRTASDVALAADAASRLLQLARAGADTALVSDSASKSHIMTRTAADTALASDAASPSLVERRSANDTALAADFAGAARGFARSGSDSALVSDAATFSRTATRSGSDVVLCSDASSAGAGALRLASDTASTADSASASRSYLVFAEDVAFVIDQATAAAGYARLAWAFGGVQSRFEFGEVQTRWRLGRLATRAAELLPT